MLGVHIDRTLAFDKHVSKLFKETGWKWSVLARFSSYMTLTQRRVLMKSFIEAQFGYCRLVWMFHGRVLNRKIIYLHECSLRIVYRDSISSFHELLQKVILWLYVLVMFLSCSYAFQSESTLYSCLNVKELVSRNRREIWSLSGCNWTRTHKHLVRKRTLNQCWMFVYELSGCELYSSYSHLDHSFPIHHRNTQKSGYWAI